jgi:hypothetical protein
MKFEEMKFTPNILIKNNLTEFNGYINFNLMNELTPNEFFVYTYLLNAPADFTPNYEKFVVLLGVKSKGTVYNVVKKLTRLNLLYIEKFETMYIWTVYSTERIPEEKKVVFKVPERLEQNDIMLEIQELEEKLETTLDGNESFEILNKIVELKSKLRNEIK